MHTPISAYGFFASYIPMHMTALTGAQGTRDICLSWQYVRSVHYSLNYEGRSTLIWQTNYIPEDTSGEVAQRKRKLFASKYLTTVTGHSSSYGSRQSIRNPEDTRDILYSSLKKHILGNDNRALLTWYLVHMIWIQERAYGSSTGKCTSTSTVAAVYVRPLVGITITYLLRTSILPQQYQPTNICYNSQGGKNYCSRLGNIDQHLYHKFWTRA